MRILTDEQVYKAWTGREWIKPHPQDMQKVESYLPNNWKRIAKAQAKETCKEIGEMLLDKWDELPERDFIVWMNGVIKVLVRGMIPE